MTYSTLARRWGTNVPGFARPKPAGDVAPLLDAIGASRAAAEREWRGILDHKWYLSERIGRDVGIRTAVVDYFENVRPAPVDERHTSLASLATEPVLAIERELADFVEAVGGTRYRPL